jgi:TATA-binding protein-associated factor
MRRGAQLALRALAHHFGGALFRDLPQLRDLMAGPLLAPPGTATAAARRDALLVLRTLVPALHRDLHAELLRLGPVLAELLRAGEEEVRTGAAQTFAALCRHVGAPAMEIFLRQALPLLARADEPNARIGAGEALQYLLEELGMEAAPYVSLLLLPALARMADQVPRVRELASRSFGALLRLAPLETGAGEPAGLSEELLLRHRAERRFVEQLLGGARLDDYEMPIAVRAELRRYQKEGVNWLAFLNRHGLHGILCDDMGLGKTLQALCILASDQLRRRERFEASGGRAAEDAPLPCLVVCPPTLVAHWALELQRFVPADVLQPLQYAGAPAERAQLRTRLRSRQADSLCVIMSYDILRNDIDHLDGLTFNYAVLDEGHLIRNPRAKISQAVKRVQARHRLILTGTPIQNSVLELWSLFDFLMPGFLGTEREFQEAYARPILASRDARAGAHELEAGHRALEALHRQVLPFILRRLKEEVLTDLPPKILQDIQCELSPLQVRLYEAFARRTRLRENLAAEMSADAAADGVTGAGEAKDGGKMGAKHVFQALQYLRKLCTHPALVLDPSHPDYEEIRRHLEASGSDLHSLAHAPKLQALRELLRQCGIGVAREGEEAESAGAAGAAQHRALVFCQMKGSLDLIEQDLLRPLMPDVSYLRLDGSVDAARRQQIVQQFNSDPTIDLLLLTTHVGGLGLNLTGADTVIFLEHDWNPQRDLQAMDRAHRIGQKRVVNVYRLITRGTLEEKIMSLQKFKLHIANQVVNVENASLQSMDLSQLLDLFNYSAAPAAPAAPAQQPAELDQFGALPEMPGKQKKKKKKTGLQAVLAELDELWDESQYAEEFNLDNFLRSLK